MISLTEPSTVTLPGVAALADAVTKHVLERSGLQQRARELSRSFMESSGLTAIGEAAAAELAGKITPKILLSAGLNSKLLEPGAFALVPHAKLRPIFEQLTVAVDAAHSDEPADVAVRSLTPLEAWSLYVLAWVVWLALSTELCVVAGNTGEPAPLAMAEVIAGVTGAALWDARKRLA